MSVASIFAENLDAHQALQKHTRYYAHARIKKRARLFVSPIYSF